MPLVVAHADAAGAVTAGFAAAVAAVETGPGAGMFTSVASGACIAGSRTEDTAAFTVDQTRPGAGVSVLTRYYQTGTRAADARPRTGMLALLLGGQRRCQAGPRAGGVVSAVVAAGDAHAVAPVAGESRGFVERHTVEGGARAVPVALRLLRVPPAVSLL